MRGNLETRITIAFAFAIVLLIGMSVGSYRSTTGLLATDRLVTHTQDVIEELNALLASVKEAESAQRGYIITGNESYLDPFHAARPNVEQSLTRLRELTKDNPEQQRRLAALEPLTRQRFDVLQQGILLRQNQGVEAASKWIQSDLGKELMNQVRQSVEAMKDTENRLLREREDLSRAAARRTLIILPLGGVLATIVTLLAYFANRRELARRRLAEDQSRAFTAELERSNRELQDFAFVASHDLQEPLRKIQAFGDRLNSKYGEAISAEGRDYLERMMNAARRMHVLINDLLTFSRVTTKGQPFAEVDLNRVAREVLNDLEVRIRDSGGQVEVDELPVIEADPLQMRQLLQNLIGNALKFHQAGKPSEVRVESRTVVGPSQNGRGSGDWFQIEIADNGIGFDEKYLDRIFTPFQRLHGRQEYEGTGMGLAVCRRIVERHGGEITARSQPGHGTTFLVTLPTKQEGALKK
ncbi:MAG TPA: CHASE3 domain-containing protein [Pyrinomonadaceae bacterium]